LKSNFLILTFICFTSCNEIGDGNPKPISSSLNKIISLGASGVEGERPNFESYRYELWKKLIDNNFTFDFIGTKSDNSKYPSFKDFNFDIDDEGRGAWISGDILEGLESFLKQTGSPGFVLLSSPGGNDALEGLSYSDAVSNLNSIIDFIQNNNPNITIIIEQLAHGHSEFMTYESTCFFDGISLKSFRNGFSFLNLSSFSCSVSSFFLGKIIAYITTPPYARTIINDKNNIP